MSLSCGINGVRLDIIYVESDPINPVAIAFDPTASVNPALATSPLLDVSEAAVRYLRASAADGGLAEWVTSGNLTLNRITVKRIPNINPFAFKIVQPLRGATLATCPAKP